MIITKIVPKDNDLISSLVDFGFSYAQATYLYHHSHFIKVNDKPFKDYHLKKSDILTIELEETNGNYGLNPDPLKIYYEDEYLLVVEKCPNKATIPSYNHYENNLTNDVNNYYLTKGIKAKIHIITRLDYPTSGLVLIAKNQYIHSLMRQQKIDKFYLALVYGHTEQKGTINLPIYKPLNTKVKRIIDQRGKYSLTEYETIEYNDNQTLVNIHLLTGRTHQIRLHFAAINHPVVGDYLYGNDNHSNLKLCCYKLEFIHPITKQFLSISINRPKLL